MKPVPFVPPNANATDLAWVGGMVYTATIGECGGVPNAVWAIDPLAETPQAISWKTNGGTVAGTLAFGSDGTVYAAIGQGRAADGGYANAVVALDPQTLQVKDWLQHPGADFVSTPVVFQSKGKEFLAGSRWRWEDIPAGCRIAGRHRSQDASGYYTGPVRCSCRSVRRRARQLGG